MGEGRAAVVATERSSGDQSAGWLVNHRAGANITARALATLCVAVSATLAGPPGTAEAKPSLKDAKAKLDKLNSQIDHLGNRFDKVEEQLKAVKTKLNALNKSVTRDKQAFDAMHVRIAQMAASAYKTGQVGSIPGLVSAKDPESVLDQISVFTQLSRDRSAEITQFLNAAQLLQREQAQVQQASEDFSGVKKDLAASKRKVRGLIAKQQALVNKLGGVTVGGIGGTYTGPASGNARIVLKWAYSKLGTPYEFGGTGPRYDCSGFTMVAWEQAGVSLPRVVPDQYNATRRVARSDLQPGDLVFFDSLGHEGIYVGGGKFIHSPHTGSVVKIDSLGNSYYSSHYYGAGRP